MPISKVQARASRAKRHTRNGAGSWVCRRWNNSDAIWLPLKRAPTRCYATHVARPKTARPTGASRASALRTEVAANEAQVEFVQARLAELPQSTRSTCLTRLIRLEPTVTRTRMVRLSNFPVFGNQYPYGRNRRSNRRWRPLRQQNVLVLPPQDRLQSRTRDPDKSVERTADAARCAGVRWKELEEEARRAGAYPGWLRP